MEKQPPKEPSEFLESFYAENGVSKNIRERYGYLRRLTSPSSLAEDNEPSFAELELRLLRDKGYNYL